MEFAFIFIYSFFSLNTDIHQTRSSLTPFIVLCQCLQFLFEQTSTPYSNEWPTQPRLGLVLASAQLCFFFLEPNHTANLLTFPKGINSKESLHLTEQPPPLEAHLVLSLISSKR